MGQVFKLLIELIKLGFGTKYPIHFLIWTMREKKGDNERIKVFFLQSSKFHRSEFIEPRTKVHRLDESYACVPKTRGFTKDLNERFGEIKGFELRRCS